MPTETLARSALTILTEEETMFRDAVRDFALGEIAPRVRAMEQAGKYD
jgi:butyryl-CoA dehydrogenase